MSSMRVEAEGQAPLEIDAWWAGGRPPSIAKELGLVTEEADLVREVEKITGKKVRHGVFPL